MNVFTKLPSVQGYGSLISTIYDDSTGTHPQAALDPCRLADGTFTNCGSRRSRWRPAVEPQRHRAGAPAPNCRQAAPSATTHRYFGQLLHVATLSIHGRGGQPISAGPMDVTMIGATGAPVGPTLHESGANDVSITLPKHAPDGGRIRSDGDGGVDWRRQGHAGHATHDHLRRGLTDARGTRQPRVATERHRRDVLGLQGAEREAVRLVDVAVQWHGVARDERRLRRYVGRRARERDGDVGTFHGLPPGLARDGTQYRHRQEHGPHGHAQRTDPTGRGAEWNVANPLPLPRALHRSQSGRVDRGRRRCSSASAPIWSSMSGDGARIRCGRESTRDQRRRRTDGTDPGRRSRRARTSSRSRRSSTRASRVNSSAPPTPSSFDAVDAHTVDVVVDFSSPEGVVASARWCAANGKGLVVGTTGLLDEQRQEVEETATTVGVVIAANYSVGAVLSEKFAAMAAPYFDRVEIIELHHDKKVDAPSGTSIAAAKGIAAARTAAGSARDDRSHGSPHRFRRSRRRSHWRDQDPFGATARTRRPPGDPLRRPGRRIDDSSRLFRSSEFRPGRRARGTTPSTRHRD